MIERDKILKFFSDDEKDKVAKILDKIDLAYRRDMSVFTKEFYTPNIWGIFVKTNFANICIEANGVFEDSERRILSINNKYGDLYPITTLKIENKSQFSKLGHKDYLGSVLSLGIQREKIGDIIVQDNCAYLICLDEIADYILYNLESIGKSKISISVIDGIENLPSIKFHEEIINVASMRIDSIVAKLANVSRSKSIDYINSSKVLVNYSPIKDKSVEIKEGMRITIRGAGKFIVGSCIGETKSKKKKIIIKKYC